MKQTNTTAQFDKHAEAYILAHIQASHDCWVYICNRPKNGGRLMLSANGYINLMGVVPSWAKPKPLNIYTDKSLTLIELVKKLHSIAPYPVGRFSDYLKTEGVRDPHP